MTKSDFTIVHAYGDEPKVEIIADMHVKKGICYLVPSGENYTVSNTEEQYKEIIKNLEDKLHYCESKLRMLDEILNPESYEDDYSWEGGDYE